MEIEGHQIRKSDMSSWATVDQRFIFSKMSDGWLVEGVSSSDQKLLMDAGLTDMNLPLRQSAAVVADLTGCARQLQLNFYAYDIADSPLFLSRDGSSQWHINYRYGTRYTSQQWRDVAEAIKEERFSTRKAALMKLNVLISKRTAHHFI